MEVIVYSIVFWIFSIITIYIKTISENRTLLRTVIKAIPAILSANFAVIFLPSALFYILLMIAQLFCALGDIGMEYNVLPGLGLFLFAHIFFTSNFILQSFTIGLTIFPIVMFTICLILMLIYIVFYYKYIKTTERDVPDILLKSVIVYAIVISLTLSTSLLLWLTSDTLLGFIPFIGTCLFVASDSLIGVKEFHHHFHKYEEVVILSTYYLAIFLISLSAIIYSF
jgi:uncharacterized membrane protein YhhN